MTFYVLMEDMEIEVVKAEHPDEATKKAGMLRPDCLVMLICPTWGIAMSIREDFLRKVPWN